MMIVGKTPMARGHFLKFSSKHFSRPASARTPAINKKSKLGIRFGLPPHNSNDQRASAKLKVPLNVRKSLNIQFKKRLHNDKCCSVVLALAWVVVIRNEIDGESPRQ